MDADSTPAKRSVEVQLGQRPGESAPAPASYLSCYHLTETAPWPYPGAACTPDWGNASCDIPLGTPEWVVSAETILESYQGTVVVIEVGKDGCLPARPDRARGL